MIRQSFATPAHFQMVQRSAAQKGREEQSAEGQTEAYLEKLLYSLRNCRLSQA